MSELSNSDLKYIITRDVFNGDNAMSEECAEIKRYVVNVNILPELYPTGEYSAQFWEHLGRAIATFSFLEGILKRAIFAFTATRRYGSAEETEAAYEAWLLQLQQVLTDQLWKLAEKYGEAVRNNGDSTILNVHALVDEIKEAAKIRNVLCHGAWLNIPNEEGKAVPFFVNKNNKKFSIPIDIDYLRNVQQSITKLACIVINSVTHMGWQFPGSAGPGRPIWDKD